jgi:hypothetical protein
LRLERNRRAIAAQLPAVSIERMSGKGKLHKKIPEKRSSPRSKIKHICSKITANRKVFCPRSRYLCRGS